MEFIIVTGLNTGNEEEVRPNIHRSKRLLNKYFCGKTTVTPVELESVFDACTVMEDKYKLGLVYILETVLRCKHHKTSIDVFCLDVVDDVEEAIPALADKWAIRKEWTKILKMLNWQATDIPTAKDVAAIFDDPRRQPPVAQRSLKPHRVSPSPPPTHRRGTLPCLSHSLSPIVRRLSTARSGSNVSDALFERLNRQLTSIEQ
ncbi:Uncharacterized protein Adt_42676 [Abeliophyllum distichum]|uniref:DUF1985 domain-containing protein n=1 Tax=Abeliophyllum distichum TaxID=126358 RepID=A0ABD1PSH4_9LAMI